MWSPCSTHLVPGASRARLASQALACALAAVVLSLTACLNDDCDEGASHCEGRELLTCVRRSCHDPGCAFSKGNRWKTEACEHACVDPNFPAFCALSVVPDPRCIADNLTYCDGHDAVRCLGGFATARTRCSETCGCLPPVTTTGADAGAD